ncbi:AAA family ATPase [Bdellovibrionota bacterium FG-1]
MILKRLEIEGYKVLRNRVELKNLGLGVYLIHGPNETGKSTLISALSRAFFDRYNTQDQQIKDLRPWGTDLAPQITVEFETFGKVYRLEKRFLDQQTSALSEWNGSRFERIADSVKADDRVRSFWLGSVSRSGASNLSNWGLARLLWMPQVLTERALPDLDETLRQHILGILGSGVLNDEEQRLIKKIDQAYEAFYTVAKAGEKKGGPLAEARDRLTRAEQDFALWKGKWDEVSGWNELAAQAMSRLETFEKRRKQLDGELADLNHRSREEIELENLLKVKEQQKLLSQARTQSLTQTTLELGNFARQFQLSTEKQNELLPQIQAQERELAVLEILQERQGLALLVENLTKIETDLLAKREEHARRKRPREQDFQEARSLALGVQRLRERMAGMGFELRFLPDLAPLTVEWQTSEKTQKEQVPHEGRVFQSLDSGELRIPSVGRILVQSRAKGTQSETETQLLRVQLANDEMQLTSKLARFEVQSIEELQDLRMATVEIETSGQALRAALNAALQSRFASTQAARSELARLDAVIEGRLNDESKDVGVRIQVLRKRLAESRAQFEGAKQKAELLQSQLQAKQVDFGSRQDLEKELGTWVLSKNSLEQECAALASRLPPPQQRASVLFTLLSRQRADALQKEEAARKEFNQTSALLDHAQAEGYYSKFVTAEEQRALAEDHLKHQISEAQGIKLLRTLVHSKRDQMNGDLLRPVEKELLEIFERIRGQEGVVSLDLALDSDLRTLKARGSSSAFDVLSLGTQEQLLMSFRLAFAKLLRHEAQLVILDDPLVNADLGRQQRALKVIKDASKNLQILILTARPQDYRSIATYEYDLAGICRSDAKQII